eukprot:9105077-Alexandrium_andersonii.AAC.1
MRLQLRDFLHAPPRHGDCGTPCTSISSLCAQSKLVAMWSLPADVVGEEGGTGSAGAARLRTARWG